MGVSARMEGAAEAELMPDRDGTAPRWATRRAGRFLMLRLRA
jgi:hypothetical protein